MIYQAGTFGLGWTDQNWDSACTESNLSAPIDGTTAIAVDLTCASFNGNFVVNWNAQTALSAFDTLAFDIYLVHASDLANLDLSIQQTDSMMGGTAALVSNYLASPVGGAFNHVEIPIGPVIDSGVASYIGFTFHYNVPTGFVFYLNNVKLLGG